MTGPAFAAVVLIPSFDPGPAVLACTVREARARHDPVWVVSDGATDGSETAAAAEGARVVRLERNGGKGEAVLRGLRDAADAGFTHALVMDADGQHPADRIPAFLQAAAARPEAMILGQPVFGPDAPLLRRLGRRLANAVTAWMAPGVGDALFGFRVYPVVPLLRIMEATPGMRGFDFDPEAAIRLRRAGLPAVQLPAAVRYPPPAQGGVSHFRYGRDNLRLTAMFARLLLSARP